jgi:FlaA1/EpsC-like NDP-sugar epimerase
MRKKGIYNIVGFVDDAKEKQHATMCGVTVMGTRHDIEQICKNYEVDEILLAIPSIEETQKVKIAKICERTGCKVKIIPHVYKAITSQNLLSAARSIQIEDLLSRDKISLDCTKIKEYINNQVVLITGGGGSIGSEICRQVGAYKPKKLIVLDNYENNAYEILLELNSTYPEMDTEVIIATVRDKNAVESAFDKIRPDVVFHAAAHKHVPLMEDVPKEAIKNNVLGTLTVAEAAIKYNTKRFVMISTDKAVNPTNVMGASKRLCEMIIQTNRFVLYLIAASATVNVPKTLFLIASLGTSSIKGTCLCAAA